MIIKRIYLLKNEFVGEFVEGLNREKFDNKFIFDTLPTDIFIYSSEDFNIYSFFGIYFLVTENELNINASNIKKNTFDKDNKINISDLKLKIFAQYRCLYFENFDCVEKKHEKLSLSLRGLATLIFNEKNCYENPDLDFYLSENGFVVINKLFNDIDKFEKFVLIFMLTLSYDAKFRQTLIEISEKYKKNDFDELIRIRDEFFVFDAIYFFSKPIKQDRHQLYDIFNLMFDKFDIKSFRDETREQISTLMNIIDIKQKEKRDLKDKKRDRILSMVGVVIAFLSFIAAVK